MTETVTITKVGSQKAQVAAALPLAAAAAILIDGLVGVLGFYFWPEGGWVLPTGPDVQRAAVALMIAWGSHYLTWWVPNSVEQVEVPNPNPET